MKTRTLYVASSSKDLRRYRAFTAAAKQAGFEIAYDWSVMVERAVAMGQTDAQISLTFARESALADALGVRDCDVFVLLAPRPGQITIGAWVELGLALGLRASRPGRRPPIIIAGKAPAEEPRQYCIFEEFADLRVDTDEEALRAAARFAFALELEEQPQSIGLDELEALAEAAT